MTIEYVILTAVGVAMLTASTRLLKTESDPAIRAWVLGWCAFIAAAILGTSIESHGPQGMQLPLTVAYVAWSAAPICFLYGVFALVSWRPPDALLPLAMILVAARAGFGVLGEASLAEALALPIEVGSHLGAAWLVWRWAKRHGHHGAKLALVSAHLLMAFTEGLMSVTHMNVWDPGDARVALSASTIWLAGVQLVIVLRRSSDQVDRMVENRERDLALLRDLAHLGTRHSSASALVRDAAALLSERLDLDWTGFWRWNEEKGHLVATEATRVPAALRQDIESLALWATRTNSGDVSPTSGNHKAFTTPNPVQIGVVCDALEEPCHHLVPLEWQGDVLGLMGVGRSGTRDLSSYVRTILPTLAGELSLTLQHVLSIQQRDRANLDLIRERLKLETVFETAPLGLLVTNGQGIIELMNGAAAEHLGCSSSENWIGCTVEDFIGSVLHRISDGDDLVERIRSEVDRRGTFVDVEVQVISPEPRTLLLFSSMVMGDDGQPTVRVWASRDVTSERALGDQLRHAQKLETIGTLSGGIAHDFNNQLAVILGNVRYARENITHDATDITDVDEALCDLERAADHCAQLTKSLLSFARRAPVSLGLVEPAELLRDLGDLLRPLIPARIDLHCETADELPAIMADAAQLQQVLVNLALNARDAIENNGEIHISAETVLLDTDHVRRTGVGSPGPHLLLKVRDTGCGVEAGALKRVFEPFYTTKAVGEGTGLGLAIVHGVVRAHSGWIDVSSERDRGTEFQIHLPAEEASMAKPTTVRDAHHEIAMATVEHERERVLVADDDDSVRGLLVRDLEARGFDVVPASDGEMAVKRFAEDPTGFAAVLLDWSMPGLEGPEAAEEIRRIVPDIPILIATGHGPIETGSDIEIIAKPFDVTYLAERLRSGIARRED